MKKLILSIVTVMCLISCSKSEKDIDTNQDKIGTYIGTYSNRMNQVNTYVDDTFNVIDTIIINELNESTLICKSYYRLDTVINDQRIKVKYIKEKKSLVTETDSIIYKFNDGLLTIKYKVSANWYDSITKETTYLPGDSTTFTGIKQ